MAAKFQFVNNNVGGSGVIQGGGSGDIPNVKFGDKNVNEVKVQHNNSETVVWDKPLDVTLNIISGSDRVILNNKNDLNKYLSIGSPLCMTTSSNIRETIFSTSDNFTHSSTNRLSGTKTFHYNDTISSVASDGNEFYLGLQNKDITDFIKNWQYFSLAEIFNITHQILSPTGIEIYTNHQLLSPTGIEIYSDLQPYLIEIGTSDVSKDIDTIIQVDSSIDIDNIKYSINTHTLTQNELSCIKQVMRLRTADCDTLIAGSKLTATDSRGFSTNLYDITQSIDTRPTAQNHYHILNEFPYLRDRFKFNYYTEFNIFQIKNTTAFPITYYFSLCSNDDTGTAAVAPDFAALNQISLADNPFSGATDINNALETVFAISEYEYNYDLDFTFYDNDINCVYLPNDAFYQPDGTSTGGYHIYRLKVRPFSSLFLSLDPGIALRYFISTKLGWYARFADGYYTGKYITTTPLNDTLLKENFSFDMRLYNILEHNPGPSQNIFTNSSTYSIVSLKPSYLRPRHNTTTLYDYATSFTLINDPQTYTVVLNFNYPDVANTRSCSLDQYIFGFNVLLSPMTLLQEQIFMDTGSSSTIVIDMIPPEPKEPEHAQGKYGFDNYASINLNYLKYISYRQDNTYSDFTERVAEEMSTLGQPWILGFVALAYVTDEYGSVKHLIPFNDSGTAGRGEYTITQDINPEIAHVTNDNNFYSDAHSEYIDYLSEYVAVRGYHLSSIDDLLSSLAYVTPNIDIDIDGSHLCPTDHGYSPELKIKLGSGLAADIRNYDGNAICIDLLPLVAINTAMYMNITKTEYGGAEYTAYMGSMDTYSMSFIDDYHNADASDRERFGMKYVMSKNFYEAPLSFSKIKLYRYSDESGSSHWRPIYL